MTGTHFNNTRVVLQLQYNYNYGWRSIMAIHKTTDVNQLFGQSIQVVVEGGESGDR